MSFVPVRQLGQYGLIKDIATFDLPINAWSEAFNVRFVNGRVRRGAIFRTVNNITDIPDTPVHILGLRPLSGIDTIIFVNKDMTVSQFLNNAITDLTPTSSFTEADSDDPVTDCRLAGVTYLNRPSHVPFYMTDVGSNFEVLPNWNSTWRCKSLRSFKDYLIALNVTKGATEYPVLFKWSNNALAGTYPDSWDEADSSKNAGEIPLSEITTYIVDGLGLRNSFIVYGTNEVWSADYVGGQDIFSFRKLFADVGMINVNCVVEVGGKHYVFGNDDIYSHDGQTWGSIIDGRNKEYLFSILDPNAKNRCFVVHNRQTQEIYFCFKAAISEVEFPDTDYANCAAVYNYVSDTWSFVDLPNTPGAGVGTVGTVKTWAQWETEGLTWDTIGGIWADTGTQSGSTTMFLSNADSDVGITANRIVALDIADGGLIPKPLELEICGTPRLSRTGIDCDSIGADLAGKKQIRGIFPQVKFFDPEATLTITLGYHDTPGGAVTWDHGVTFDPATEYKIDSRINGRYLAMKLDFSEKHDAEFSGYDVDIFEISRR